MTLTTDASFFAAREESASGCGCAALCALWFLFGRGGIPGRPAEIIPHPV
jgi:hypothetical protein